MIKKIILGIVILGIVAAASLYYLEYSEEKELQEYANSSVTENTTNKEVVADVKIYSLAEVTAHNNASDCWMVIDKDVLDVTSFIDKHPGGSVITDGCGKDATSYFTGVRQHLKPIVKTIYSKLIIGKFAGN